MIDIDGSMDATAQSLTPNEVTGTRWRRSSPGYLGFIFVKWVEVETLNLIVLFGFCRQSGRGLWCLKWNLSGQTRKLF